MKVAYLLLCISMQSLPVSISAQQPRSWKEIPRTKEREGRNIIQALGLKTIAPLEIKQALDRYEKKHGFKFASSDEQILRYILKTS